MLASASGELNTRSEPNVALQSRGQLEDAALALHLLLAQILLAAAVGHILAEHHDALVALHLVLEAGVDEVGHRLLAAGRLGGQRRTNRLGLKRRRRGIEIGRIQILHVRPGLGKRRRNRFVGGVLHFVGQVEFHLVQLGFVENALAQQEGAEARDRIALDFRLALGLGTVKLLVIRKRMRIRTNHVSVHERRALAGANVVDRRLHRGVAGEHVGAVHLGEMEVGKSLTSLLMLPPGVLTSTGTEMAYSLSSMTNSIGSLRFDAVFSDSQNSPWLVVPSPQET